MNIQPPPTHTELQAITQNRVSQPRKLDHASINSLAYDLVTGVDRQAIYTAYMIDARQLHKEITTNPHLIEAIRNKRRDIQTEGSFATAIKAAASETLPHVLADNVNPETEASVRSRNMKMFMDYAIQKEKIQADLNKSDKPGTALGVQVNFNVSPGIRGISAPEATINQEQ